MVDVMTRLYAELAQSYMDHARCMAGEELMTAGSPVIAALFSIRLKISISANMAHAVKQ